MVVAIRLASALRELAEGRSHLEIEVPEDASVGTLLDELGRQWPQIERRVRDEQGRVRRHVNVFLGDRNCRDVAGLATPLAAGQEVSILPAVSGGAPE
jgi:sulfur-carrier protein